MIRLAEFAVFLVPIAAFVMWRTAVARGLDGPAPRQLGLVLVALITLGSFLVFFAVRERLPPGHYVPATVGADGRIAPGHSE